MSLKLAIDNGEKHLENMNADELVAFQQMVVGLPHAEQTALLDKVITQSVPALQVRVTNPDWLESDFNDSVWQCKFASREKTIDFNIHLEDGSLLTAPNNAKFLYTIKYWLCALSHPINNGGNYIKPMVAYRKLLDTLLWIDAILMRAERFHPAKYGFSLLTSDDIKAFLRTPSPTAFYLMNRRIEDYLRAHSAEVTDSDIVMAAEQYPTIRKVLPERTLDMTDDELVKARVWLLGQGGYRQPSATNVHGNCNGTFFKTRLNKDTLHGLSLTLPAYPELRITPNLQITEYRAVPVTEESEDVAHGTIRHYLSAIKSINIVNGDQFAGAPIDLSSLTVKSIESNMNIRQGGRFRTLPASVALASVNNAFEFCLAYADDILRAMVDFAVKAPDIPIRDGKDSIITAGLDKLAQQCCSPELLALGVRRWRIVADNNGKSRADNYFQQLRKNAGLHELYQLLMGCAQIIVGTMMARRVSELIELKEDCLHPNTDPTLPENEETGYFLNFFNRKSGAGEDRESLLRPILLAGAKLLWKLRCFREELIDAGLVSKEASLLLNCSRKNGKFGSVVQKTYSDHLDTFCDYFETPVIEIAPNEFRRYYIRQHQLRRFFAMSFFWGSSETGDYKGLDALRYFLGHTDAEHLYHYITETTPGAVLRGVKAETLVQGINADKIEGVEKLRELLKKRFGVSDVTIEALEESVEDLEEAVKEGDLITEPPLEELRSQIELDVEMLLQEGTIDLEPEFIVMKDAEGNTMQVTQLVLRVKEAKDE
ncbi:trigger factor family protein [Vibrio parahaemolyticus]|nr:trigger factor family protein [Vibrio parahaemolyticus]